VGTTIANCDLPASTPLGQRLSRALFSAVAAAARGARAPMKPGENAGIRRSRQEDNRDRHRPVA